MTTPPAPEPADDFIARIIAGAPPPCPELIEQLRPLLAKPVGPEPVSERRRAAA